MLSAYFKQKYDYIISQEFRRDKPTDKQLTVTLLSKYKKIVIFLRTRAKFDVLSVTTRDFSIIALSRIA